MHPAHRHRYSERISPAHLCAQSVRAKNCLKIVGWDPCELTGRRGRLKLALAYETLRSGNIMSAVPQQRHAADRGHPRRPCLARNARINGPRNRAPIVDVLTLRASEVAVHRSG